MKKMAITLFALLAVVSISHAGFNIKGVMNAGNEALKVATLTDAEVNSEAARAIVYFDGQYELAPASSSYTKRLAELTKGMTTDCNQTLDIQAYQFDDVNAFAVANGSIRIHSGLMDRMSDDEVRYVIAHEIGHVSLGHSKNRLKMVHAASAGRKMGAASENKTVSMLSDSALGDFAEKLVNAQFSQSQELDADMYALKVMKNNGYDQKAAVSALRKLEVMFGNEKSVFSSHPAPGARAATLEKSL
jgi:putative metalloprotease